MKTEIAIKEYAGGFVPGDVCKYNGVLPIGRTVSVVKWEPEKWSDEGCDGCFTFRKGLVPVFSQKFPETKFWWVSPIQLNKTTLITAMFKLEAIHGVIKRLQGADKFAKTVEEWTPVFIEHANRIGKTEVLEVAIDLGKLLSSGGHESNEVLAVAVELIEQNVSLNPKHRVNPAGVNVTEPKPS